ncbi:uridine kinase [Fulvitalea axinellae]|uniref:uridine/cytidine kinase n=1 Tax=Fulvitalea axinellae TaxID=1182444 RepID=A0AAU9D131_9BACT|nr:uridine kinase [Fulvitalea axinellae]
METPYFVGITGGSASGKTRFLNQLMAYFGEDDVTLISQDNYYKPRHLQPVDENGVHNFDKPESIDFDAFMDDIDKLKNGETAEREEYMFNNPNATPRMLSFKPAPIVIVEGLFVFYDDKISASLDTKVYIDAQEHIKLKRRIIRDNAERGYDLDDVLYRYERHVMPTYERYIKPTKYEADIVVPNNTDFKGGLEILVGFMRTKLNAVGA